MDSGNQAATASLEIGRRVSGVVHECVRCLVENARFGAAFLRQYSLSVCLTVCQSLSLCLCLSVCDVSALINCLIVFIIFVLSLIHISEPTRR